MKSIFFVFLIVAMQFAFQNFAMAQEEDGHIYIKVGEANVKKSLIATPPFLFLSTPSLAPNYKQVGTDLFNTVINDLEVSNLFTLIKQQAYLEDVSKVGLTPAPDDPTG